MKSSPSELSKEYKISANENKYKDSIDSQILPDEKEGFVQPQIASSEITVESEETTSENTLGPEEMQQSSTTTKSLVDLAKTASSKLRLTNQADVDKINRLLDLSTDLNISYYKDDKGRIIAEFLDPEDPTLFIETEIMPPEESEGLGLSTHFEPSHVTVEENNDSQTNETNKCGLALAPVSSVSAPPKRHILPPRATNQVTLITFPKSSVKKEIESLQKHLAMRKSITSRSLPHRMEAKPRSLFPDTAQQPKLPSDSGKVKNESESISAKELVIRNEHVPFDSASVTSGSERMIDSVIPSSSEISVTESVASSECHQVNANENNDTVHPVDNSAVASLSTACRNNETNDQSVFTSVPSSDNTSLQVLSQGNQVAQSVVNDILRMNNVNVSPGSVVYIMSGDTVYQVQTPD